MSIQNIVTIENTDHQLDIPAQPVTKEEFGSAWLHEVVQNLRDTLNASKSPGIAASQIGIYKQIIAFGGKPSLNFPEFNVLFTTLINPSYEPVGDNKVTLWEHCLSYPGKRGRTVRYARIIYSGRDINGKEIKEETDGILAVLLQHEIDHTKGRLFPSLVPDPAEYGDISYFEASRGSRHHIEYGLQALK